MNPTRQARFALARALALAVALVAIYAAVALRIAPTLPEFDDLRHHVDFTVGVTLPLHVVWQPLGGWRLVLLVWVLAAGLAVAGVACTNALRALGARPWALVAVQGVMLFALLAVAVSFSGDVYAYVIYGRLYGIHGVNPYLLGAPLPVYDDPVLRRCLSFYGNPPPGDNYGPLWTLAAGLIARVQASWPLGAQVWTHRALAAAAAVAATGGLLHLMRRLDAAERIRRAGLFALNPLVLYETAVGGHNDMLMIAPAIWAFAVADDLPLVAGLLMAASISVKYVSAIALPFLALRIARRSRTGATLAAVISLAVPALFFQPFWAGPATLFSLIGHGGVLAMSPQWLVDIPFFSGGLAAAPAFGSAISLPLFGQPSWPRLVELAAGAAFLVVFSISVARFARAGGAGNAWRSITAFVWSLSVIHPWYVLWIMPAAASAGRWATYAWWFGIAAFARYALDGAAPSEYGPAYTATLAVLTVVMLGAPAVLALRDTPSPARAG